MNDGYKDIKARIKLLDTARAPDGTANTGSIEFSQALNQAHRLVRRGDRSREPSTELRASVDKAEALLARLR